MNESLEDALADAGTDDPRSMSRALGVLLCFGGLAIVIGMAAARPEDANLAGLSAVGAVALALGFGSFAWAPHARVWTAHALFATGTSLICLGAYFAGAASGLYAVMLVWLAIVAASFFSERAIVAHVLWILVASAATLSSVSAPPGASSLTRWIFGGVLLAAAAAVMSRIAAGRRATEERLRGEIAAREQLQREREHLADHDPLTGVANRRRLEQDLERELGRARRDRAPLSVVALDLDNLKEHNDAHGHAAGDRVLEHVASAWAAELRATDAIARTGGDEFVVLLPDCPLDMAERLSDDLCLKVADTCRSSAGVALWNGRESADELLARADRAMYDVKARRARPAVTAL